MQISDTEMDKEQQKEELQMEDQIGWKKEVSRENLTEKLIVLRENNVGALNVV